MGLVEDKLRVLAGKAGRFVRGGRGVGVGMVVLMLVGAIWLGTSVTDTSVPADAKASQPGSQASQLRPDAQPFGRSGTAPTDNPGAFNLDDGGDIWRTDRQNRQRWQAAKMAKLSRLISNFETVRTGTVLFESGSPRRLGTPAVASTAAVNVKLATGHRMTPELIAAIADLVSGSIAGMDRRDVRIIDSLGVSYRIGDESSADSAGSPQADSAGSPQADSAGSPQADSAGSPQATGAISQGQLRRMQSAEHEYAARVRKAVADVPGAMISVSARLDGRVNVLLIVPRSHLLTIATTTDRDALEKLATAELSRLRTRAMAAAGLSKAAVEVSWYGELPGAVDDGEAKSASALFNEYRHEGAIGLFAAGLLAGLAAIRIHKSKRPAAPLAGSTGSPQAGEPVAQRGDEFEDVRTPLAEGELRAQIESESPADKGESSSGAGGKSLAFLSDVSPDKLAEAIAEEHPQTIALLMSRLTEPRAAGVLARLDAETQGQVVRRLAGLEQMDSQVMGELWRALAERLEGLVADRATGTSVGRVVQILHHAGYETERVVLESLADHAPQLADSIRNRMFAFEDIVHLSNEQLAPALVAMDSDELAVALRTTGKKVRKRVFSALSSVGGKRVRREMERIGPVRLSDIEAAQHRVVELIRRRPLGQYVSNRNVSSKAPEGTASDGTAKGQTELLA